MTQFKSTHRWHISCTDLLRMIHNAVQKSVCAHCGTPFISASNERFCCAGCEVVFSHIQDQGLDRFYALRDASPPLCTVPAETSTASYEYCDAPEFISRSSPDGRRLRFYVEGLNCSACIWLLERLPSFCPDAEAARVDMSKSTIDVTRVPGGSFANIARALDRLGYRPRALRDGESSGDLQTKESRRALTRVGIAAAATGNIMILAVSLYAGASGDLAVQFRWVSAFLATPVLTYCAWPFYRSAWFALKARTLNLDVPIVAALLAGATLSVWNLAQSKNEIYFDSLSMLVFLLLSSRLLLKNIQYRQLSATNLESDLLLNTVDKVTSAGEIVPTSSLTLAAGDIVRVNPGTMISADGIITCGTGFISTAVMTGESEPMLVALGDRIEAGSESIGGNFDMKVEKPAAQSRLAQILRDTESAAREKSLFVQGTDRVARWFIGVVFLVAISIVIYFSTSDVHEGFARALALIIVTCPCVFGMAIPLSMALAVRAAARMGIVIKSPTTIERLWAIDSLIFDKTGTLTAGRMVLAGLVFDDSSDLEIAMGLELNEKHPVARALLANLAEHGVRPRQIENVTGLSTGGVIGTLNGVFYSLKPLNSAPSLTSGDLVLTSIGLFREDQQIAQFDFGDRPRPEALGVVAWAREHFTHVELLSGDREHSVRKCARIFDFNDHEIQFARTPEQKAEFVRSKRCGVAMIGDGANDASALAAADVGIAVYGSLDVSLRAADVYLTRQQITSVPRLFDIAALTRSAIYRNLGFSVCFNVVAGTLAMSGAMTPLWAAVLMPVSSFTVLLSAQWTGRRMAKMERSR